MICNYCPKAAPRLTYLMLVVSWRSAAELQEEPLAEVSAQQTRPSDVISANRAKGWYEQADGKKELIKT